MKNFPQRLKALRKEKNLTQTQLAEMIGISRGALSLYETGRREPDYCTLQKFADFFNVSTDYLLGRNVYKKGSFTSTFAKRLKQERQQKQWSLLEMSQKLGIRTSQLSDYEKGLREPDLSLVVKIAKLLNVSVDYLLGISGSHKGFKEIKYKSNKEINTDMFLREDISSMSPELATIIRAALKLARKERLSRERPKKEED